MRLSGFLIAALPLLFFSVLTAHAEPVAIYIDIHSVDELQPIAEINNAKFKKLFSGSPYRLIFVSASDQNELEINLQKIKWNPDDQIKRILMSSHGASGRYVRTTEQNDEIVESRELIMTDIGGVYFNAPLTSQDAPEDNQEAERVFAGIRTHMSDDVMIYCTGCNTFKGSESDAMAKASSITTTMGATKGMIYGNTTSGIMNPRFLLRPFWKQPTRKNTIVTRWILLGSLSVFTIEGLLTHSPNDFLIWATSGLTALLVMRQFHNRGREISLENGKAVKISKIRSEAFAAKFFGKKVCSWWLNSFSSIGNW